MSEKKPASSPFLPFFRLGVRCLCFRHDRLLLIRHFSPVTKREFWALPGGLVEKGETLVEAARRELAEETGIQGIPTGIAAVQEFPDIALLEVVIAFSKLKGRARLGFDPEQSSEHPKRMRELKWFQRAQLPPVKPELLMKKIIAASGSIGLIDLPHLLSCD
ncbi:MAG TPA: NUDIX domain-containing protein [Candidatus Ozemobacteraceae bacterium]|nr:NUDIX domain-containing protein [Candidatus Ozemobacteraceae bacterium]